MFPQLSAGEVILLLAIAILFFPIGIFVSLLLLIAFLLRSKTSDESSDPRRAGRRPTQYEDRRE